MNTKCFIAPYVQSFFQDYLARQRGLSQNTVLSYRDCLKLLLGFVFEKTGIPVDKLSIIDFKVAEISAFLDHLENIRGNSTQTRNYRLAAIHAFFRFVGSQNPMVLAQCQQICSIPVKRTAHKAIQYLEYEELRAILDCVDRDSKNGLRDYAIFLFMYNTGARVQEVVNLREDDIRFITPQQVRLTGKGRKERACPLWHETVVALQNYLQKKGSDLPQDQMVFLNSNGVPITRFGIRYLLRCYADKAIKSCPSLKNKTITPHTMRHTTAMHLLQSGNDIFVIKDWLGHASVETTHGYVEINMKMKRAALETCQVPSLNSTAKRQAKWMEPDILRWLDDLSQ